MLGLVIGGSGSGKSEFAEEHLLAFGSMPRYYIATMECNDAESLARIKRHQAMRSEKQFETIECGTHVEQLKLQKKGAVLLECLSNLLANELYSKDGSRELAEENILNGIDMLCKQNKQVVIVSNDVFADGTIYDLDTMEYIERLGRLNTEIAKRSDEVYEVIYGIPVKRKG